MNVLVCGLEMRVLRSGGFLDTFTLEEYWTQAGRSGMRAGGLS